MPQKRKGPKTEGPSREGPKREAPKGKEASLPHYILGEAMCAEEPWKGLRLARLYFAGKSWVLADHLSLPYGPSVPPRAANAFLRAMEALAAMLQAGCWACPL